MKKKVREADGTVRLVEIRNAQAAPRFSKPYSSKYIVSQQDHEGCVILDAELKESFIIVGSSAVQQRVLAALNFVQREAERELESKVP